MKGHAGSSGRRQRAGSDRTLFGVHFLSFFFLFLSLFSFPFYIIIGQSRVALGCLFLPIRQIKIGKFPSEFANWLILFGRDPVNQSPVGVYVSVIDRN